MNLRFIIFISIFAIMNVYAFSRIITRWQWAKEHYAVAWSVVVLIFMLELLAPLGDRMFLPRLKSELGMAWLFIAVNWVSYTVFGMVTLLAAYGIITDIGAMVWRFIAPPTDAVDMERRVLLTLGVLTVGSTVLGIGQAHAEPNVKEVKVPIKDLPEQFEGFRIAQISDLHVGPTIGRRFAQTVVNRVNLLDADVVALTGDFADGHVKDLKKDIAPIAELKSKYGVYYVTGNHEYYWDAVGWVEEFEKMGAKPLINKHEKINVDGAEIALGGVSDYSTRNYGALHASSPKKAFDGVPESMTKILLAHQPNSYAEAYKAGVNLQLSGHTHAGQYFPFSLLIPFFQKYYKGLNRHEDMWVYVNTGTGYWGPPMRAGVPSEITLLTLHKA
ncbi:metallophosphoesterase [Seleniivibrio sp.]|uniref:metallophosphoesterase n=1 Tax=Seleniivibrio sp. TaxID=2898801 RepID=UPI0025ED8FA5|nr:metallophosphoesterase [Seleniivibrio sp.]MCD8554985.1 metallophosphoesterase [Seleniivibrio sp.]